MNAYLQFVVKAKAQKVNLNCGKMTLKDMD